MPEWVINSLTVVGVLIVSGVVVKLSGVLMRRVVRRFANRRGSRMWRPRARRASLQESTEVYEQHRRQRIDAGARGINHLVAVGVWIAAVIVIFKVLDVDATFYVSSAGFIGVAVAFGGQSKVSDYLTGLSVLFEDRYGAGDDIEITTQNGGTQRATVEHVGLVTTRLRDRNSTYHVPNSEVAMLRNLSQDPGWTRLTLDLSDVEVDDRGDAVVNALRRQAGSSHLTDVFFVGDLAAAPSDDGIVQVDVQTVKPLDERTKQVLVKRAEATVRYQQRS